MKKFSKVLPIVFLSVLTSSSQSGDMNIRGSFLDSPVEGLEYICGETKGVTDSNGRFECSNFPVKFKVGEAVVGSITSMKGKIVTPQDLVGVGRYNFKDQRVINIARFLQSLDDDGVIKSVIKIDDNFADNLQKR